MLTQNARLKLLCVFVLCVFLDISFGVIKGNEIKTTKATIRNFIHFDTISEQSEQHGLYPHRCRRSYWVQERYTSRHPVFQHHPIVTQKTTVFSWCMLMMGIHGIFKGTILMSLCFFPRCIETLPVTLPETSQQFVPENGPSQKRKPIFQLSIFRCFGC